MRHRVLALILTSLALLFLTHCETARFYAQGARGQWQIQTSARPISQVLASPDTTPALRQQLLLVLELRQFAATRLGLPITGQYHRYADLKRDHLVWVVFAADELSLKPHLWRYPFLGELAYRGYFRESDASQLAMRLSARGHDTFVAPVDAYSTLGWFSDPVLNTFVDLPPRELAELLFHELAHQRLYLPGDTEFNEALATALGRHASRQWLKETARWSELRAYERENQIMEAFVTEIQVCRQELEQVYANNQLSPDQKRQAKTAAFKRLRQRAERMNQRFGGTLKIDKWFKQPVNNARLNSIATYHQLVPEFTAFLEQDCAGNVDVFFNELARLKRLTPEERLLWLRRPRSASSTPKHSLVTPTRPPTLKP